MNPEQDPNFVFFAGDASERLVVNAIPAFKDTLIYYKEFLLTGFIKPRARYELLRQNPDFLKFEVQLNSFLDDDIIKETRSAVQLYLLRSQLYELMAGLHPEYKGLAGQRFNVPNAQGGIIHFSVYSGYIKTEPPTSQFSEEELAFINELGLSPEGLDYGVFYSTARKRMLADKLHPDQRGGEDDGKFTAYYEKMSRIKKKLKSESPEEE